MYYKEFFLIFFVGFLPLVVVDCALDTETLWKKEASCPFFASINDAVMTASGQFVKYQAFISQHEAQLKILEEAVVAQTIRIKNVFSRYIYTYKVFESKLSTIQNEAEAGESVLLFSKKIENRSAFLAQQKELYVLASQVIRESFCFEQIFQICENFLSGNLFFAECEKMQASRFLIPEIITKALWWLEGRMDQVYAELHDAMYHELSNKNIHMDKLGTYYVKIHEEFFEIQPPKACIERVEESLEDNELDPDNFF